MPKIFYFKLELISLGYLAYGKNDKYTKKKRICDCEKRTMESSFHQWVEERRMWRTKSEMLLACCGQLHVWCGPDFTVGLCVCAADSFSLVSNRQRISERDATLTTFLDFDLLIAFENKGQDCSNSICQFKDSFSVLFAVMASVFISLHSHFWEDDLRGQFCACGLSVPVVACRGHAKTAIWSSSVGSPETYNIPREEKHRATFMCL